MFFRVVSGLVKIFKSSRLKSSRLIKKYMY